jgi:Short C-terminal domain/Phospholipase_D-nuclease N-terminal
MLIAEFGTGQVFWSMLWFFLFFMWIMLVVFVFSDIFRSDDMGGWGKALWTLFIIVLPYLGVFVYLLARGRQMGERSMRESARREVEFRDYVQDVAAPSGRSPAEEVAKLADLRDRGVIDEREFQEAKAKALA